MTSDYPTQPGFTEPAGTQTPLPAPAIPEGLPPLAPDGQPWMIPGQPAAAPTATAVAAPPRPAAPAVNGKANTNGNGHAPKPTADEMAEWPDADRLQIIDADDTVIQRIPVPEWRMNVYIRGLTGTELDSFQASMFDAKTDNQQVNLTNLRSKLMVRAIVNVSGQRLFSDREIELLGRKSGAALNRLFLQARELSGLTQETVDELTKNSDADPSDDSTSA